MYLKSGWVAPWKNEELKRFKAAEGGQGVAVDEVHFYAINNYVIGKYRKDTGARVAAWEGRPVVESPETGPAGLQGR